MKKILKKKAVRFLIELKLKLLLLECSIDDDNKVIFRKKKWVLCSEPLKTGIIHQTHTSIFAGYSDKEITYKFISKKYFWPSISENIKKYIKNCDIYKRTKT